MRPSRPREVVWVSEEAALEKLKGKVSALAELTGTKGIREKPQPKIKVPKHQCIADPNTMMRATHKAPIYKCRIHGCEELVYSSGVKVDIEEYNLQIALDMLKHNGMPVFWAVFGSVKGVIKFYGIFSTSKNAIVRMKETHTRADEVKKTGDIVIAYRKKKPIAYVIRLKLNEDAELTLEGVTK
jgi:hypothetical protein